VANKSDSRHSALHIHLLLHLPLLALLVLFFALPWLDAGLPGEDFPANVAWFADISKWILGRGLDQWWAPDWLMGTSRTLIFSKMFGFVLALPFHAFGPEAALKLTTLVLFHIASGFSMWLLLRRYCLGPAASLMGAVFYTLSPVYLLETATHGHFEVSLYYAFVPLILWAFDHALESQSLRWSTLTGLIAALGLWVNNEGSAVTLPFLIFPYLQRLAFRWNSREQSETFWAVLGRSAFIPVCATVSFIFCSAFFLAPALLEQKDHYLFHPSYIRQSILEFSYRNPLYLLDRSGMLLAHFTDLPEGMRAFSGQLYPGAVALLLALFGLAWRREGRYKRLPRVFLAIGFVGLLLSFGGYSVLDSVVPLCRTARMRDLALGAIFLASLAIVPVGFLFRYQAMALCRRCLTFLPLIVALLVVLSIPWFRILSFIVPIYSHMRAPIWFFITPVVFGVAVLAAMGADALLERMRAQPRLWAAWGLLVLAMLDVLPYRHAFQKQISPQSVSEMKSVFEAIGEEPALCRSIVMESYSPFLDLGTTVSGKPSAWGWLNWDSTKTAGEYVLGSLYPRLSSSDADAQFEAANLASMAGIGFLVDDLGEPPNLPPNKFWTRIGNSQRFALYRNSLASPMIRLYAGRALYLGPAQGPWPQLSCYLNQRGYALATTDRQDDSLDLISSYDAIFWAFPSPPPVRFQNRPAAARPRIFDLNENKTWSLPPVSAPAAETYIGRPRRDEITIHLEDRPSTAPLASFLGVAEAAHPNWTASVDGKARQTVRLSWGLIGVPLRPGDTDIRLSFAKPRYFSSLLMISLFSALAVLALFTIPLLPGFFIAVRRRSKSFFGRDKIETESIAASFPEQPASASQGSFSTIVAAVITFAAPLAIYAFTLAPTISGDDAGELVSAAYHLGVPHPPGYPLWTLMAHVFTRLPLAADIGRRVNWMSAVLSASCALLLFAIARRLLRSPWVASLSAIAVCVGSTVWMQSVIAKGTYGLTAFLCLLCLAVLQSWDRQRSLWKLCLFAHLFALGIVSHYMTLLFAPAFAYFILSAEPKILQRPRHIALMASCFLAGLSVFLLLIPFARAHPPINWGNPDNLRRWLDEVRRVQYRGLEFSERVSIHTKLLFLWNFAREFSRQLPWPWLVLVPFGWFSLFRSHRRFTLMLTLLILSNAILLTLILHFQFTPENLERVQVYYIPSYILSAFWLAAGIEFLCDRSHVFALPFKRRKKRVGRSPKSRVPAILPQRYRNLTAIGLSSICVLHLVARNWRDNDMHAYYLARDYAENTMKTLPPNAITFPVGDYQTFPLLYLQCVEDMRPDVLIGDLYGYLEEGVYKEYEKVTGHSSAGKDREEIIDALVRSSERPVLFFQRRNMSHLPGLELRPWGILYKVARQDAPIGDDQHLWRSYKLRGVEDPRVPKDYMGKAIISCYSLAQGERMLLRGDMKGALAMFNQAVEREDFAPETSNNCGSILAELDHPQEARRFYLDALQQDPGHLLARRNLGSIYMSMKIFDKAAFQFRKAIELDPGDQLLRELYGQAIDAQRAPAHPPAQSPEDLLGGATSPLAGPHAMQ